VLGFLKFEDDDIVFNTEELESINQAIDSCLQEKEFLIGRSKTVGGFYVYSLNPRKLPTKLFGKKHMMRISVPSTILYTRGKVGKNLLRDIINAIYLHCLYKKMSRDKKSGIFKNAIDSDINAQLMENTLDKMGGRTADVHNTMMSNIRYILALLALLVATSAFFWSIFQ